MNRVSKILLLLILIISVVFGAVACSSSNGIVYKNIETITVNEESIADGFLIEDFDISKVLLDVKYFDSVDESGNTVDGETVQIKAEMSMVRAEEKALLSVPGSKTITLIYGQFEIPFILTLYNEEVVKFNVTFLDEEGNRLGDIQRITKGGTALPPTYPTKDGYDFIGWVNRENQQLTSYSNITSDLILQAKYEPKMYSVKFFTKVQNDIENSDSTVGGDDSTPGIAITEIDTVDVPRGENALDYAPTIPVIPGYSNGRWENEDDMDVIDGTVLEFYAVYDQDTVTVVFNYKKNNDESEDEVRNYLVGDQITEAFNAESKSGKFKFVGWYTDQETPKLVEFPYTIKSEMKLVAKYINVAEGNVSFTTNDGGQTYLVNGFDGEDGVAVIPNTYNSKDVVGIEPSLTLFADNQIEKFVVSPENEYFKVQDGVLYDIDKKVLLAFPNSSNINNLVLPSTVTRIEKYAFCNAKNLQEVTFNNKLENIGKNAFQNCTALTSLQFPDSLLNIEDSAFMMNESSEITQISFIGNPKITTIGDNVFNGLNNLVEFDLPSSVTSLGKNVFANCLDLNKISTVNNTSFEVDEVSGILYNSDRTELYVYPANCIVSNKTDVVIPSTVQRIKAGAFSYSRIQGLCINSPDIVLESNSISSPYISKIRILSTNSFTFSESEDPTYLGNIFGNDFIPSNFYVANESIKTNIENYYISSSVESYNAEEWVELVDYDNNFMFRYEDRATEDGTITEIVIIGAKETSRIMEIPATLTNYNVVKIAPNAFAYDTNITKIVLPSAIEEIGDNAFAYMPNLKTVVFNDYLKKIGNNAFYGSENLDTIEFSENVVLESVGVKAFENTQWYEDDTNEFLTINNWLIKYNGYGVTADIPSNIEYIASEAFINKTNLTNVNFGKLSVSTIKLIGKNAFDSCESLIEIKIPNSIQEISENAFVNCINLKLITFDMSKENFGNVTIAEGAIDEDVIVRCTEGEEVNYKLVYHNGDETSSQTGVIFVEPLYVEDNSNYRFAGWYEDDAFTQLAVFPLTLTDENTVEEPDYRTKSLYAKLIEINNDEGGSEGLKFKLNDDNKYSIVDYVGTDKYVVIPKKYKGKRVTSIAKETFKDKIDIIDIAFPYSVEQSTGKKDSDISYIGIDAFKGTKWFDSVMGDFIIVHDILIKYQGDASLVEIPDYITSIADGAFYNNDDIEKVVIPDGVTELGDYLFYDCDKLKEIQLSSTILTINNYVFADCDNLETINFSKAESLSLVSENALENTKWLNSVEDDCVYINNILYKYQGRMDTLTIPNGIVQIANNAFENNMTLDTINVAQSVEYIGQYAFNNTFVNKINIFSSGSKLSSIGDYAFANCTYLESINIQSTDNLVYIGDYAFVGTSSLSVVTIPKTVTYLGEGVFSQSGIENLIFESNSKLTTLPKDFCKDSVVLAYVIFNGDSLLYSIGSGAFSGCTNLEIFRNRNAILLSIGDEAFMNCSRLDDVETKTKQLNYIGVDALLNMGYVSSTNSNMIILGGVLIEYDGDESVVEIPNTIFTIYDSAFKGKTSIEEIVFTDDSVIQRINNEAFYGCTELEKINFPDTIEDVGNDVMTGTKWLENEMRNEDNDFIHISNSLIKYKGDDKQIIIPEYITVINSGAFAGSQLYNITLGNQIKTIKEGAFDGIISPTLAYKLNAENEIVLVDETEIDWNVAILPEDLSKNPIEIGENTQIPKIFVQDAKAREDFYLDTRWDTYDSIIEIASYYNINYLIDEEKGTAIPSELNYMIYKEIIPETNDEFVFAGWFLDKNYTTALKYPLLVEKNIIIYAKFVEKAVGTADGVFHFGDDEESNDIIKYTGSNDVTVVIPTTINGNDLLAITGVWTTPGEGEVATHIKNESTGEYEVPIDLNDATHLYKGAFEGHNELNKFYFADNSKIDTIGKYAFRNCKLLTTIVLPSSITTIEENAFEGCSNLENIVFTNGESMVTIKENAFKDCTSLTSIVLPDKVDLENNVFVGCDNLVNVYVNNKIEGDVHQLGNGILPFAINEDLQIHIYSSIYDIYKNRWSSYIDYLVEVEDEEE